MVREQIGLDFDRSGKPGAANLGDGRQLLQRREEVVEDRLQRRSARDQLLALENVDIDEAGDAGRRAPA